ncbi:hypothetical protein GGP43_003079 [Salinibacter ruber]|nr:hypothetical protein [Salinibacter ruber]
MAEEDTYHAWSKLNQIGHMGHVKEYTGSEVASFTRSPENAPCGSTGMNLAD